MIKESQSCTRYGFDIFDLFHDAFQASLGAKFLKPTGMFWVVRELVSLIDSRRRRLVYDQAWIPAASLLTRHLGMRILPAEDGSNSLKSVVSYEVHGKTLRLPVLTLKPRCGTLIRNLMA
ncbi:unnamed protein product [Linum tenue]|uniref:Uncharacterized protein n=1 Tax=Linum tenue TaxID=586396 RepID=A0AAV0RSH2_9ROSI|nr:unnamed protein product [Linum tenue]